MTDIEVVSDGKTSPHWKNYKTGRKMTPSERREIKEKFVAVGIERGWFGKGAKPKLTKAEQNAANKHTLFHH